MSSELFGFDFFAWRGERYQPISGRRDVITRIPPTFAPSPSRQPVIPGTVRKYGFNTPKLGRTYDMIVSGHVRHFGLKIASARSETDE
jgi:hypothetical protein